MWIRIAGADSDYKCGFGLCADMDCCRKGLLCVAEAFILGCIQ